MATVIQANLNHSRRAQDLLGQRMREIGAGLRISFKIASKSYEKRLFQSAPVCVRSPSEVASMFRFCELETRFSKKLRLDIPE